VPPIATDDEAAASELRGAAELAAGLPADNLTILGLARRFAAEIRREPRAPEAARARLSRVVRHAETRVEAAWLVASTRRHGVEALSYRLHLADGLSAEAVRFRAATARDDAKATILIGDGGRARLAEEAAARVNRGETVLAADLAFLGEAWAARETRRLLQNLNGLGERPLGVQAAQLQAVARWLKASSGAAALRLEASGPRSQAVALVASGLEPGLFFELVVRDGLGSFAELLDKPVEYMDAPELFCLDLYRELDLPELAALSSPARVVELRSVIAETP
jgi:hypothetical protein